MTTPWSEVAASPDFVALPPDAKEAARQQYFNEVVAPNVPPQHVATVKQQFDADTALKLPLSQRAKIANIPDLINKAAYGAGGAITDVAAKVLPPEAAAGIGFAANVGAQAAPMVFGGEAAKFKPVVGGIADQFGAQQSPGILRGMAERLMTSALKPGVKPALQGKGERAVNTLLNEGVNVTPGGVEVLHGKVDVLNNAVVDAIQSSGVTVDKAAVASRIQDVVNRIERTNPTPQDAVKDVEKVYNQFIGNQLLPSNIPATRAQEVKQGIYQLLRDKYGALSSDTVEAQKALARGFKEELAAKIPEISQLNAKESELINALNLVERRVAVAGNKNPIGLGLLVRHPAAMASFLADRSELFKSIVARMINAGQEQVPATAARAGLGAYQAQQIRNNQGAQ